jgi:hypothetical protein
VINPSQTSQLSATSKIPPAFGLSLHEAQRINDGHPIDKHAGYLRAFAAIVSA